MFSFKPEKLNTNNRLGGGFYGNVYPYQSNPNDLKWVVKHVQANNIDALLRSLPEIVLGFSLDHPAVLPICGYHIEKGKGVIPNYELFIKIPRMEKTLKDSMEEMKFAKFSKEKVVIYFYTLACGLEYLHKRRIAHGDIKPSNILFDFEGNPRISDIGTGQFISEGETRYVVGEHVGTSQYLSPESFAKKNLMLKRELIQADAWSLGLTILELCLMKKSKVVADSSAEAVNQSIEALLGEMEVHYNSSDLKEILSGLLRYDPEKRLSVGEAREILEEKYKDVLREELVKKLRCQPKLDELNMGANRKEEREKEKLLEIIKELEAVISEMESDKTSRQTKIGNLEHQISGFKDQILELFAKIVTKDEQKDDLMQEIDKLKEENRKLQSKNQANSEQVEPQKFALLHAHSNPENGQLKIEGNISKTKEEILQKVYSISQEFNKQMTKKNQELFQKYEKNPIDHLSDFKNSLEAEYTKSKAEALEILKNNIFNNQNYAIVSDYYGEFQEALEYDTKCLYSSFCSEWKSHVLLHRIGSFEPDLLHLFESSENKENEPNKIFLKDGKLKFGEQPEMVEVLTEEIYSHFVLAEQSFNKKNSSNWKIIPSLAEIVLRCKSKASPIYNPNIFLKMKIKKDQKIEDELKNIENEFSTLLKEINELLVEKSKPEIALRVFSLCMRKSEEMKRRGIPVIRVNLLYFCFLESIYMQFSKTKKRFAEAQKIEEIDILNNIIDMQNSFLQGIRTAKHHFKEIRNAVFLELTNLIAEKIRQEIKSESFTKKINQLAFEKSFLNKNFENVVKYVIDTEKFKREIYLEEIQHFPELEFKDNTYTLQNNLFFRVMSSCKSSYREWGEHYKAERRAELGTVLAYVTNKSELDRYFPDLYSISIRYTSVFSSAVIREFDKLMNDWESGEKLRKEEMKKDILNSLSHLPSSFVECQERCPRCQSKCLMPGEDHFEHFTDFHILPAFRGFSQLGSKKLSLSCCFDPQNHQIPGFFKNSYQSYEDLCKSFPEWRQNFPPKYQFKPDMVPVSEVMKECWVGTKDIFMNHFNYYDNRDDETTPRNWLNKVEKSKILKINMKIEGYYSSN